MRPCLHTKCGPVLALRNSAGRVAVSIPARSSSSQSLPLPGGQAEEGAPHGVTKWKNTKTDEEFVYKPGNKAADPRDAASGLAECAKLIKRRALHHKEDLARQAKERQARAAAAAAAAASEDDEEEDGEDGEDDDEDDDDEDDDGGAGAGAAAAAAPEDDEEEDDEGGEDDDEDDDDGAGAGAAAEEPEEGKIAKFDDGWMIFEDGHWQAVPNGAIGELEDVWKFFQDGEWQPVPNGTIGRFCPGAGGVVWMQFVDGAWVEVPRPCDGKPTVGKLRKKPDGTIEVYVNQKKDGLTMCGWVAATDPDGSTSDSATAILDEELLTFDCDRETEDPTIIWVFDYDNLEWKPVRVEEEEVEEEPTSPAFEVTQDHFDELYRANLSGANHMDSEESDDGTDDGMDPEEALAATEKEFRDGNYDLSNIVIRVPEKKEASDEEASDEEASAKFTDEEEEEEPTAASGGGAAAAGSTNDHPCPHCDHAPFKRPGNLDNHIKRCHPDEVGEEEEEEEEEEESAAHKRPARAAAARGEATRKEKEASRKAEAVEADEEATAAKRRAQEDSTAKAEMCAARAEAAAKRAEAAAAEGRGDDDDSDDDDSDDDDSGGGDEAEAAAAPAPAPRAPPPVAPAPAPVESPAAIAAAAAAAAATAATTAAVAAVAPLLPQQQPQQVSYPSGSGGSARVVGGRLGTGTVSGFVSSDGGPAPKKQKKLAPFTAAGRGHALGGSATGAPRQSAGADAAAAAAKRAAANADAASSPANPPVAQAKKKKRTTAERAGSNFGASTDHIDPPRYKPRDLRPDEEPEEGGGGEKKGKKKKKLKRDGDRSKQKVPVPQTAEDYRRLGWVDHGTWVDQGEGKPRLKKASYLLSSHLLLLSSPLFLFSSHLFSPLLISSHLFSSHLRLSSSLQVMIHGEWFLMPWKPGG